MARAKIATVKGKKAIVLPDDIARRLHLHPGDAVYVRETGRGIEITGMSPTEEDDLRNAQETMRAYREKWRFAGG